MNRSLFNIRHNYQCFKCMFMSMPIVCFLLFCLVSPVMGEIDLLEMPSVMSNKAATSVLLDVANAGGRLVAVGERGHIVYSDNDGKDWTQADVPVSVTLTAVTFLTAEKGWAVGHDSVVLHSSDGGETWQKQIDGWKINDLMLAKIKERVSKKQEALKIAENEQDEERVASLLQEIDDLGFAEADMAFVMKEGASRPLMDLWFKNEKEGIIVGAFGTILKTLDGGTSWEALTDCIENPFGLHYNSIIQVRDALYIAGEAGMLFRSDDFGQTWKQMESPYEGSFFGIVGNPATDAMIAFGLGGKVFYSPDSGEAWLPSKNGGDSALFSGLLLSDGSFCIAGINGNLAKSIDGGKTFETLPVKVPPPLSIFETGKGHLVVAGLKGAVQVEMSNLDLKK